MNRRKFVVSNSLAIAGLSMYAQPSRAFNNFFTYEFVSNRPPIVERTYTSEAVEKIIAEVKKEIKDDELAWMFENCYPNTLDTTVDYEIIDNKPDTFIITGDIDAMWLRDSTAQVWPYMPLITKDGKIKNLIKGLVNRQAKCVLKDPYANAFYKDLSKESHWKSDQPSPIPGVHERKWEIDSLCYVIRLAYEYYRITGDTSIFDSEWDKAMRLIVKTLRNEQRKEEVSPYYFIRQTTQMIDAPLFGSGRPIKPVGLIASMFRPSDDATMYPYLIPSNIFAVISLQQLAHIYNTELNEPIFAKECTDFSKEVDKAIQKYAVTEHFNFGEIYAYEVDGFGNKLFMDDANVPSLMSLAYLDTDKINNQVYKNTRKFLLSNANPYYLKGSAAEGQASPHTGKDKIWPMGIILRGMTSQNDAEIAMCLQMLKNTHAGTGFMHEAFHKNNPKDFNRLWFAWANTLFGELIIKIYNERKEILKLSFD